MMLQKRVLLLPILAFLVLFSLAAFSISVQNISVQNTTLNFASAALTCQTDWGCPVGQVCNGGYCGTQMSCSSVNSYRCPAGQVCDKLAGLCKAIQCYENSFTCKSSPFSVCEDGLCIRKTCTSDSSC